MFPSATDFATPSVYMVTFAITLAGAFFGYTFSWLAAWLVRCWDPEIYDTFGHRQFRTVAMETGIQNVKIISAFMQVTGGSELFGTDEI